MSLYGKEDVATAENYYRAQMAKLPFLATGSQFLNGPCLVLIQLLETITF